MGGIVFPPCYLTWGQTMVEVMKIMATSFKKSLAGTATVSALDPAASHRWSMPPPESLAHSRASLGQSLVGSLLLSPGSWCTQVSVCVLPEPVSPVLYKFLLLYGGLMATSSKRTYAIRRSSAPRAPAPAAGHCWPYLLRRHTNTALSQSLWGLWVLVCTRYVWALWASLVGMGFDSKCNFAPPTILLGLQEKMSTRPSTLPYTLVEGHILFSYKPMTRTHMRSTCKGGWESTLVHKLKKENTAFSTTLYVKLLQDQYLTGDYKPKSVATASLYW